MSIYKDRDVQPANDIKLAVFLLGLLLILNPLLSGILFNLPLFLINGVAFMISVKRGWVQVEKACSRYSSLLGGKRLILSSILFGILFLVTLPKVLQFIFANL